jgi:hypothetical protein
MNTPTYQCCFCGKTVEPVPPDVGSLLFTTCHGGPSDLQHEQIDFCHAECLRARLHPSATLYAVDLLKLALRKRSVDGPDLPVPGPPVSS